MATPGMSRINSAAKGKVYERAVVRFLTGCGFLADRTAAILESMGGITGVDIRALRKDGLRLAVQAKVGARPDLWGAVKEVDGGAHDREIPIVIAKRNRGHGRAHPQEVVVMSLEAFRKLMEEK